MKLVTYSDRSFVLDDVTADALIEFAAVLISAGEADSVEVNAFSEDDEPTTAKMLLGAGTPIVAETISRNLPEIDNSEAQAHIAEITRRLTKPTASITPVRDSPQIEDYGI